MGERAARTAKCLWCGVEFTAPDLDVSDQLLYCKHSHAKRASRLRQKNAGRVCLRPDKRKYYTRRYARERLEDLIALGNADLWTRVYLCGEFQPNVGCGFWHIGNPRKRKTHPVEEPPEGDMAERLAKRFRVTRGKS